LNILDPFLAPYGLDFNDLHEAERWWPLGKERSVVIDPERSFGAPIASRSGVPTQILHGAFQSARSYKFVANWYAVDAKEVRDAVTCEERLAA
jgi:uncharacterized protein (DUF433 family)